ncbi:MAG: polysaccharide biosynthesis/export family protein, partial [Planctomycetota bacterium]
MNDTPSRITIASSIPIVGLILSLVGCGTPPPTATFEEVVTFSQAGPAAPQAMNIRWKAPSHASNDGHEPVNEGPRLMKAQVNTGPYRVAPGDLLGFTMPQVMRAVSEDATAPSADGGTDLMARVSDQGEITLPSVGPLPVAGRTLSEIEATVMDAYHPKYLVNPPAVVAQVHEYRTLKVTVVGAVNQPGEYDLRSDEMTLNAVLTKAS